MDIDKNLGGFIMASLAVILGLVFGGIIIVGAIKGLLS